MARQQPPQAPVCPSRRLIAFGKSQTTRRKFSNPQRSTQHRAAFVKVSIFDNLVCTGGGLRVFWMLAVRSGRCWAAWEGWMAGWTVGWRWRLQAVYSTWGLDEECSPRNWRRGTWGNSAENLCVPSRVCMQGRPPALYNYPPPVHLTEAHTSY